MNYARILTRSTLTKNMLLLMTAGLLLLVIAGCGPKAVRGGPGTENPEIDDPAMSVKLDRRDKEYMVQENTDALSKSMSSGASRRALNARARSVSKTAFRGRSARYCRLYASVGS